MSRRVLATAAVALFATVSIAAGGCSSTVDRQSVQEGLPVHLGNLEYNVQISRLLNPNDAEDQAYLQGAPPLPRNDYYLGIFLQVHNHGSSTEKLPTRYVVTDTEHDVFLPVPVQNDFALPLGGTVPAHGQVPDRESLAASGPIEGLMVLFLIHTSTTENRPLILKIPAAPGDGHPARIELDL
jgi:hypothetical protein